MALTVLEKLKLTKQLRDLNTEAAGLGAGAASAVKKLKIAKAMLELRAQLGLGAAKPDSSARDAWVAKMEENGTLKIEHEGKSYYVLSTGKTEDGKTMAHLASINEGTIQGNGWNPAQMADWIPNAALGVEESAASSAIAVADAVIASADAMKGRISSEKVMDVPDSWIVLNAPRPLLGTKTLEGGPFLSGRFYAAIDPAFSMAPSFLEENRKLDAVVVVFATKEQQIEMALIGNEYAEQYRADYQGDELYEVLHPLDRLNDKTAGELKTLLAQIKEAPGSSAPVTLIGNELGDFPDTEDGKKALRSAAREFLMSLRGQEVDCPILGRKVEIRKRGINETIAFSANPKKLKLLHGIRAIIKSAFEKDWQPNTKREKKPDVDGYFLLKSRVVLGEEELIVDVLIEKDSSGVFHYDLIVGRHEMKMALDSSSAIFSPDVPKTNNSWHSVDSSIGEGVDGDNVLLDSADDKMVLNLFIEGEEPEPAEDDENVDIALLRQIASGGMDGSGEPLDVLKSLYEKIAGAVNTLNDGGLLTGDAEDAANAAITHWAELEERLNG